MAPMAACEYGAKEQTAEHVITPYSIYQHPNGTRVLLDVDKSLLNKLTKTCPAIQ